MGILIVAFCLPFLPALVSAQCSGSKAITTQSDADAISSCGTFDGDVLIGSAVSGDISLDGIKSITGDLVATNATSLASLNANKLTSIGGTLNLSNLPELNTVAFASLQEVQDLRCTDLPALQSLPSDTTLSKTENLHISNTGLVAFAGITLTNIGSIDMRNNVGLATVDFGALANSSSGISFQANAPNITIQLTSLQIVYGNLNFQNISALSISDLQNITGSFTCYSCAMTGYNATWVQIVGGDLAFVSSELHTLEFPALTTVGGSFQLSNNSQLASLSSFPWLASVHGALTLDGAFNSVDFPSLEIVQGNVEIQTTSSNTSICNAFTEFRLNDVVKGSLSCQTSASGTGATNSSTGSLPGTDSAGTGYVVPTSYALGSGALAGIIIGGLIAVALVGLAIFFLYRRRARRRSHLGSKIDTDTDTSTTHTQLPFTEKEEKAEMYVDPRSVAELKAERNFATELDSDRGIVNSVVVREVPGIHEASAGTISSPNTQQEKGTSPVLSPISSLTHEQEQENSRSPTSAGPTIDASKEQ